jgi:tRNA pseudouridine32 synthase/23S rRNA pseudouridine746 synthase
LLKNNQKIFKGQVLEGDPLELIEFLELKTKLSKSTLKKVLNNGGVWLKKFKSQRLSRVRRATTELNKESYVEFFYDEDFLNLTPPNAICLQDYKDFGIWNKPQGLLSQGNEFGDHCTILRQVEKIKGPKKAFLVHRLDREAHGLMIIAYNEKAARIFSDIFKYRRIKKFYKTIVLGDLSKKYPTLNGRIDSTLDGKEAKTTFQILKHNEKESTLLVEIHTGRMHQIRRHFESISHPVLGDPKYGVGNKNKEGLKLLAYKVQFTDPYSKKEISFALEDESI